MLDFLKKKQITPTNDNPKGYPKEVLEIHHEFHTAAEKLVESAKSIIADAATKDVQKVSRLEKLGFKQAAQVTETKPFLERAVLSEEQIKLVGYYQKRYPLNKFITEEQVKTICHKYNLVCGEVNRFKGFVPEKNLRQIEGFTMKEQDVIIAELIISYTDGLIANLGGVCSSEITKDYWNISNGGSATFSAFGTVKDYFSDRIRNIFKDRAVTHIRVQGLDVTSLFKICAPIKDMDISGLELIEGYKLQKRHVPDPIVLKPVIGGYLIVTAWGDEASDELVVNSINN
jgi:hypothetical protein